MSGIKPAEVSEILKKELEGLNNISEFEEVGVVLEVGDGIARIYGLTNVQSGELIEFENSTQPFWNITSSQSYLRRRKIISSFD